MLNRLAIRAKALQTLEIKYLGGTTAENRSSLFDFVCEVAGFAKQLKTLTFFATRSSGEQGEQLLTGLAEQAEFKSLETLTI